MSVSPSAGDSKRAVASTTFHHEMSLGGTSASLKSGARPPIHRPDSLGSGRALDGSENSGWSCLSCIGSFFVSCWDVIASFFSSLFCCSSNSAESGMARPTGQERKERAGGDSVAAASSSQAAAGSSGMTARAFYLKYHAMEGPSKTLVDDIAALPDDAKARIPNSGFAHVIYQELWSNNSMGTPASIAAQLKESLVNEYSEQILGEIEQFIDSQESCGYGRDYDGRTTGQQRMLAMWKSALAKKIFKKVSDPIEQAVMDAIKRSILQQLCSDEQVRALLPSGQSELRDAFTLDQSVASVDNRDLSVKGLKNWVEHVKGREQREAAKKAEMEAFVKEQETQKLARAEEAQVASRIVKSGEFESRLAKFRELREKDADSSGWSTRTESQELLFIQLGAFVVLYKDTGTPASWKQDLLLMEELDDNFFTNFQFEYNRVTGKSDFLHKPYSYNNDMDGAYAGELEAWRQKIAEVRQWVIADEQVGNEGILSYLKSRHLDIGNQRQVDAEIAAKYAAESKTF